MSIPQNILVATDFSPASGRAVHYACDLAKESSAKLHVLNVSKTSEDSGEMERTLEQLQRVVDARTELELETFKKVVHGDPGTEIVNYARDNNIDVIVVGTHGRSGWAHLAMGSVAENVLKDAPCPVTVLGPQGSESATYAEAVQVIEQTIDNDLSTNKEEGRSQLLEALARELRIPSTTAILILDELEDRKWVLWENDSWGIVEGFDLLETLEPLDVQRSHDSQAIDIIKRACRLRASDIHVDPNRDLEYVVRFRIDGQLREYCRLSRSVGDHLINQCKSLAQVEHADPFHVQEGRVQLPPQLKHIEVRYTSVPVPEGQAITLRILDPQKVFRPLDELGFSDSSFQAIQSMLHATEGLILVTGPTGSGKTTTVYSMLEEVGGHDHNIVSIEDPVEFMAPFVRQISVDDKHGLSMARGLRTLLRMDPDVLFIGEIRDQETAEIALRAAGTGKYVFSTLHTRDAESTVMSLLDLGVQAESVAANLVGVINQRLVPKLCENCKVATEITAEQRSAFEKEGLEAPEIVFVPDGCSTCSGTGYRGRIGVFEVAIVKDDLRQAESSDEIESMLAKTKITSLTGDSLTKVASGLTSFADAAGIRWLA